MNAGIRASYRASWLGQPSRASRGRILLTQGVLMILCLAVLYGARVYVHDQRENAERDLALVEQLRCEQRVEGRNQLRSVFSGVFALIDELSPGSVFTARANELLDQDYPPLSLTDCFRPSLND